MISTVIFDMDGLLVDTEPLHRTAYQQALRRLGVPLSEQEYEQHWIRGGKGIADFVELRGLRLDADAVRRDKKLIFNELVALRVQPMPGALELLTELKGTKVIALATASYQYSVDVVFRTLGLEGYFDLVASKGSVQRSKPFPDVFLYVAENVGVEPHNCVVLEDSERGVEAAYRAGMKCIAVPNQYTRHHDFSTAGLVLDSLHEVSAALIDSLDTQAGCAAASSRSSSIETEQP